MIYLIIITVLIIGVLRFDVNKVRQGRKEWLLFVSYFIIALFAFRYRIGSDSVSYQYFFEKILPTFDHLDFSSLTDDYVYEPGFVIFMSIIKTVFGHWLFFQIISVLIITSAVFNFFKKNSPYGFACILLFFLLCSYSMLCESIRQSLAMSMFLFGLPYLQKKQYIKYYLFLIPAFFFHYSSAIMVLIPFLTWAKVNNKFTYLFLIFLFVVGGTIRAEFGNIVDVLGNLYAGFERAKTTYGEDSRYMSDSVQLWTIINAAFRIITLIFVSYYTNVIFSFIIFCC